MEERGKDLEGHSLHQRVHHTQSHQDWWQWHSVSGATEEVALGAKFSGVQHFRPKYQLKLGTRCTKPQPEENASIFLRGGVLLDVSRCNACLALGVGNPRNATVLAPNIPSGRRLESPVGTMPNSAPQQPDVSWCSWFSIVRNSFEITGYCQPHCLSSQLSLI